MLTKTRWPHPRIIAHRGGGILAPENTLVALRLSASLGFAGVEVDAQLAACGNAFLLHDDTLERTTDGSGPAHARTLTQLRTLDAGGWFGNEFGGEHVPAMEAACALCRSLGQWMNVEIKVAAGADPARTGATIAAERARRWADTTPPPLVSSFSEAALAAAARNAPSLPRGLLLDRPPEDWADRATALGCSSVHVAHEHVDAALVETAHARGLAVVAYTVNDPGRAFVLFDQGVDAIVTDELRDIRPDFLSLHSLG